ncbi:hypothetical protein AB0B56_13985 [Streptosporangium canum]|uniref:hypothetical protein n=1 Tax=Streptosporangium canum TaxID=324952 RepID=UPI0034323A94
MTDDISQASEDDVADGGVQMRDGSGRVRKIYRPAISHDEKQVISEMGRIGYAFVSYSISNLHFSLSEKQASRFQGRVELPRYSAADLKEQLAWGFDGHPVYQGYIAPSRGVVELVVMNNIRRPDLVGEKISGFSTEGASPCAHSDPARALPSLKAKVFYSDREAHESPRVHVHDAALSLCMEISNISPLALLFCPRFRSGRNRFLGSIKLDFQRSMSKEQLLHDSERLIQSFLYELDIRNKLVLNLERRESLSSRIANGRHGQRLPTVRFPETNVRHEVASLFNFAGSAIGNWPLAFLSYYQSLEYFIPIAARKSAIRRMRKELTDPIFDRSRDEDLVRILAVVEASTRSDEASHFSTLISECVRRDRVVDFLTSGGWGEHFTKRGPIKGVESLNPDNGNRDILDQVASRIYKIRNRIVHAKDDPRFANERVLLPRSDEAEMLGPDVQLIRLLATEVILDAQSR